MYRRFVKRALDLLFAVLGLPVLLVLIVMIAPVIHFTDGGPVFYGARRIGRRGRIFTMYKFRSMRVDAPDIRLSDGSTYNGAEDPRVTPVGRFLRRTSLDETPQLINILRGQMSLIGPRPDPPDWLDRYPSDRKGLLLSVKPGVTGYNQAFFRNAADGRQKMENDAFYALRCSFSLDVRIFLRTVQTVLLGQNLHKQPEDRRSKEEEGP